MTTPSGTPQPGYRQPTPAQPGTPTQPAAQQQTAQQQTATGLPPAAQSALDGVVKTATAAATQAKTQVGKVAVANRDKIESTVDKLGPLLQRQTGRTYDKQLSTVKKWIDKGIDAIAPTGAAASNPTSTAPTSAPAPAAAPTPATPAAPTPATPAAPAPAAPAAPVAPEKPKEGWHRGPDGQWVRS